MPLEPAAIGPLARFQPPEDSRWRLRQVDGRCVYATAAGCSIHGRAPAVCREFDCRRAVRAMPARSLARLVAIGVYSAEVVARGRALNRRPETRVKVGRKR